MTLSHKSRTLLAVVAGAGWVALVEIVLAARRGAGDLPWIALATFALTLPLGLVGLLPGLALRRLVGRGRRAIGAACLALALALHVANATVLVRLYLSLHMLLGLATVLAAVAGVVLLIPDGPEAAGRGPLLGLLGGVLVWMALFGLSLWAIADQARLRATALDQTTLLAQELLALHQVSGILEAPEPEAAVAGDLATRLQPAPLERAAGPLRGANVLVVTVDSLRVDALPHLPRLAALGESGFQFRRAWAPSCWTHASMVAIFVSKLASQITWSWVSPGEGLAFTRHAADDPMLSDPTSFKKVMPVPLDDTSPTLAERLRDAGYDTAAPIAYRYYVREAGLVDGFQRLDDAPLREHNLDNRGVTSRALTDAALALLQARPADRPFLLWVHYMDPHAPYFAHDVASEGKGARVRYESELRLVDAELGRLLAAIPEDTIVVAFADHGEEFRDHGGEYHAATLYQEIVHVPFLLRLPPRAGLAPRAIDDPVSLLDLVPTVYDLVGVNEPTPILGRSLLPLLRGESLPPRPIRAECRRWGRDKRAILEWPMKLIADPDLGAVELYDLTKDPGEKQNLVDARSDVVDRLLPALHTD